MTARIGIECVVLLLSMILWMPLMTKTRKCHQSSSDPLAFNHGVSESE